VMYLTYSILGKSKIENIKKHILWTWMTIVLPI